MFAVVNHLHLNKPVDGFKEILMKEGIPLLATHPGFVNLYVVKVTDEHAIIIILWQDNESAVNGAKKFGPEWFVPNIKPFLTEAEGRSTGEVMIDYTAMK
jgi:hypothetical protein